MMKPQIAALVLSASMYGFALGQPMGGGYGIIEGPTNFGSNRVGFGNAGGFVTGSGFNNSSMGSANFGSRVVGAYGYGFANNTNYGAMNAAGMSAGAPYDLLGLSGLGLNGLGYDVLGMNPLGLNSAGFGAYGLNGMGMAAPGASGFNAQALGADQIAIRSGYQARNYQAATGQQGNSTNTSAALQASPPIVTPMAQRLQDRLNRSPSKSSFQNIKVLMSGRTAVLQGTVDAEADERLVQRLLILEPGVDSVRSELRYPGKVEANKAGRRPL